MPFIGRVFCIDWIDSTTCGQAGWVDADTVRGLGPALCRSVGLCVSCDEQSITLAAHFTPPNVVGDELDGEMCIPRVAIRKVRDITDACDASPRTNT